MTSEAETMYQAILDLLEKVRGLTFKAEPVGYSTSIRLCSAEPVPEWKLPYSSVQLELEDSAVSFYFDVNSRLLIVGDKSMVLPLIRQENFKLDLTAWDMAVELAETTLVKMREMKQELEQYT